MVHVIHIEFEKCKKLTTTKYFENHLYVYNKRQDGNKITYEKKNLEPIGYDRKVFYDGLTYYIYNSYSYSATVYISNIRFTYSFDPYYHESCSFCPCYRNSCSCGTRGPKKNNINQISFCDDIVQLSLTRRISPIEYETKPDILNIPVFSLFEIMTLLSSSGKYALGNKKKQRKLQFQIKRFKEIQKDENFSYFFVNKWREKILPIINDFIINPHKDDCSPVVKKYFQINIERYFLEMRDNDI